MIELNVYMNNFNNDYMKRMFITDKNLPQIDDKFKDGDEIGKVINCYEINNQMVGDVFGDEFGNSYDYYLVKILWEDDYTENRHYRIKTETFKEIIS